MEWHIQLFVLIGIFGIMAFFNSIEHKARRIEPAFTLTGFLNSCFFIFLLWKWIGTWL